jgi:peptide deformylase
MAFRKILKFPHQDLLKKSELVCDIDDSVIALINDLRDTVNVAGGIGLSAPQIGVLKRVIYVACDTFSGILINPVIKEAHDFAGVQEQCLSFPGVSEIVPRYFNITVEYIDDSGQHHTSDFDGLASQVIQHEVDHLDGKLIVHHLSRLKQRMIRKRVNKVKSKVKKMLKSSDDSVIGRNKKTSHLSRKEVKLRRKRRKQSL